MRKCFLTDDSGHWYAVSVDRKGFFESLLDCMDDDFMLADTFDSEFAEDRLEKHVSNYSFDDLMEM